MTYKTTNFFEENDSQWDIIIKQWRYQINLQNKKCMEKIYGNKKCNIGAFAIFLFVYYKLNLYQSLTPPLRKIIIMNFSINSIVPLILSTKKIKQLLVHWKERSTVIPSTVHCSCTFVRLRSLWTFLFYVGLYSDSMKSDICMRFGALP